MLFTGSINNASLASSVIRPFLLSLFKLSWESKLISQPCGTDETAYIRPVRATVVVV